MGLFSCLHPVTVHHHGTDYSVSCGKCAFCRSNKKQIWSQRLEQEITMHPYSIFFTLKYTDDNVPMLRKDGDVIRSYEIERNLHGQKKILNDNIEIKLQPYNDFEVDYYKNRQLYPYCRVKDLQDFIKRIRKHISRLYCNHGKEKDLSAYIKYFVVSEYGPTTFRPHYHGILFIDSTFIYEHFREIFDKSWQFGSYSYSLVQFNQKCARYVAKYVNIDTDLPSCYFDPQIRTKYLFSKKSIIGFDVLSDGKIEEIFSSGVTSLSVYNSKKQALVDVPLPQAVESRLYPRFPDVADGFDDARDSLYTLFNDLGCPSWRIFKKIILNTIINGKIEHNDLFVWDDEKTLYDYPVRVSRLLPYFIHLYQKSLKNNINVSVNNIDFNNIRQVYYRSRHFCYYQYIFHLSVNDYINRIDDYYQRKEYNLLVCQCKNMEDYCVKYPDNVEDLVHIDENCYNNLIKDNRYYDYVLCDSWSDGVIPSALAELPCVIDRLSMINELETKNKRKGLLFDKFDLNRFRSTLKHFGYSFNLPYLNNYG